MVSPVVGACGVSTHSRPKAAGGSTVRPAKREFVSTHSRPKAAGGRRRGGAAKPASFNSQPPEGGWMSGMKP